MSIFSLVCVSDTVATTKGAVWVSGVFAPSKTFKLSATFNTSLATNHKQSFDLWTSLGDVLQEEEESFHFGVASPAPAPLFFFSSRSFLEKVSLKLRHLLYTSFTFFRKEKVTETYYARFLQTFLMKYWWHKLRSKKKKKNSEGKMTCDILRFLLIVPSMLPHLPLRYLIILCTKSANTIAILMLVMTKWAMWAIVHSRKMLPCLTFNATNIARAVYCVIISYYRYITDDWC